MGLGVEQQQQQQCELFSTTLAWTGREVLLEEEVVV